jgi:hypothetical protein
MNSRSPVRILLGLAALFCTVHVAGAPVFTAPDADLKVCFANPPAASRILKIVHALPGTPEKQQALFDTLQAQGFGGVVSNVSFTDYLESESKWSEFVAGMDEARQRGMALWLYDELGYPSGKAGGITLRDHPEWQARGLYFAETTSEGGAVSLAAPPGALFQAAAYPLHDAQIDLKGAVDLSASVVDGTLQWDAPPGAWWVAILTEAPLHDGTHADGNLSDTLPYPNLLMREPTDRFLEVTHDAYAQRLGHDLGAYFTATFTDEPSLMSMYTKPRPYRMIPWSPGFRETFRDRRGYAIEPLLPALVAEAGSEGQRARYDFWNTVGELVSENYFGAIQEWCQGHKVLSGGHLLYEEPVLAHVPLYGDFFRCLRRMDAPGIDCLTSIPETVPWYIARLASSAAELEGRTVVMCETSDHSQVYRPEGDTRSRRDVTEDEIRGTCNRLILNGVTTITSYYTFAGLNDDQLNRINTWIGRCTTMLAGGRQVADIAVLYPAESIWPRFVPALNHVNDSPWAAHRVADTYLGAVQDLYAHRRDFTVIDARTLAEAETGEGSLTHRDLAWRAVVLPAVDTLPLEAWKNLAAFWRMGGAVIALGALPANAVDAFPSPEVQALGNEIFGNPEARTPNTNAAGGIGLYLREGEETLLAPVLEAIFEPELRVSSDNAPLRVTHRAIGGHDLFFVINDSANPWQGEIGLAAAGPLEQWDPASGSITALGDARAIPLDLSPWGGVVFRLPMQQRPPRLAAEGVQLPQYSETPIPVAAPSLAGGEFVTWSLAGGRDGDAGSTPWRAEAQLTRGGVDTFLFATFTFVQPPDLDGATAIALDLRIPEGQTPAAPMYLILRDTNGAEYIAQVGATHASGAHRVLVRREQFSLAGWSAAGGNLDLAALTDIRIGWGGYLGREDERITFEFGPPRAAYPQ